MQVTVIRLLCRLASIGASFVFSCSGLNLERLCFLLDSTWCTMAALLFPFLPYHSTALQQFSPTQGCGRVEP